MNGNIWFDFKGGPVHHLSDHYYSPTCGPKEDRNWSPHVDGYELMVGVFSVASTFQKINSFELDVLTCLQHRGPEKPASYHSKIDADIDSLTSILADLDSHTQDSSAQVGVLCFATKFHAIARYSLFLNNFLCLLSCTTTCLTTNTSQGIITSLHTRTRGLLRVGQRWATLLIPKASTTQGRPTPVNHLSTPLPTSRTTTRPLPRPLSPTLSLSQPPTPPPPLPPGPGSASRSKLRSQSHTLRPEDRLSRPTPHLLPASTCRALLPNLRQICRVGTLRIKLRRCTPRQVTRGCRDLWEGLIRFRCQKEGLKTIKLGQETCRLSLIHLTR